MNNFSGSRHQAFNYIEDPAESYLKMPDKNKNAEKDCKIKTKEKRRRKDEHEITTKQQH